MATPTKLDTKLRPVAERLIRTRGKDALIIQPGAGTAYNPDTGRNVEADETVHEVRISPPFPYHDRLITGDIIQKGDLRCYVADLDLGFVPENTWKAVWEFSVEVSGITYSMAAGDNSLNDSGSGLVSAGFEINKPVIASGFTDAENNGYFTADSVAAGKIVLSNGTVVDEAVGDTVKLWQGEVWFIENVNPIYSGQFKAIYELQLRR